MSIAVAALILAFLLSYLITPLARGLALRHDFVDRPDAHCEMQTSAVALGGGAVLLAVTLVVVLLVSVWWGWDLWIMARKPSSILALCGAAVLLVIVGLVDDAVGIRGSYKLFWQAVAASLVMGAGLNVPKLGLLGVVVELGVFGHLFTVAWLLGAINSFNLIDGIDGLAGSVGVVFSLTFGLIALWTGNHLDSVLAFALAGSLLGFLRYNLPPATIHLGGAGSMLIGLILGTIALRCAEANCRPSLCGPARRLVDSHVRCGGHHRPLQVGRSQHLRDGSRPYPSRAVDSRHERGPSGYLDHWAMCRHKCRRDDQSVS